MRYNGNLAIATGHSAKSKKWKNTTTDWADLVTRLTTPHPTNVTYKEYVAANKTERLKIKDVGGYVGGYLRNGRRKPENVGHRQLITLDLDFAEIDTWDNLTLQFENAAVLHSTHSHSPANPKYRLIMPLSREASADEYVAVARQIAGALDIELFDNTSFQPYRLMFWPASPKDVEFYSEVQDGPWIDVDEVLASYIDWRDSSLWPTSSTAAEAVKSAVKKQQDPTEKKGIVGAFCRTYDIPGAIAAFLEDEYVPAGKDRYTYTKGSTGSGLAIYDEDRFAYSNHGTDPISGTLVNAYDLVRVHQFGHLDEDSVAIANKRPSYRAMEDFARKETAVRRTIAAERLDGARYAFADGDEDSPETTGPVMEDYPEEADLTWAEELEINARGQYLSTATNLNLILANDARLKGAFRYNAFDTKRYLFRSVPWRKIDGPEPIKNVDYSGLRNYLETIYGISGVAKIEDCLALEFERYSFHPVKDYLEESALIWDGKPRIDDLLIKYFGAEANCYTKEAIRKMLVAAVARIFRPGTKYDLVLTLVGGQGTGKSTFVNRLGGAFFSDSFMTIHGNQAFEQLQGAWLIEMAELSGMRKQEVEAVKHYISKQEDTFRPAYARSSETFPRQCVFFGTTNNKAFLTDPTGNRRFMPIDVRPTEATESVFAITPELVAQIWGEAVDLYRKGEKLYLSAASELIAKGEQAAHAELDDRTGLVEEYLDLLLPKKWEGLDIFARRLFLDTEADDRVPGTERRESVCVAEVYCELFGKTKDDLTRYNTRDINDILRSLPGWEAGKSTKNFPLYGKQRFYYRS